MYTSLLKTITKNYHLIIQLSKREINSRYKGSVFGAFWSVITPLFMLLIYTFVFSQIFKAKWGDGTVASKGSFAVILFAGMVVYTFFADVINRRHYI